MSKNKWGIEIQPKNICAIDASTNSLAFAFYVNKNLGDIGKIRSATVFYFFNPLFANTVWCFPEF